MNDLAESMVRLAYGRPGDTAVRIDIGTYASVDVVELLNIILKSLKTYDLRLCGVRTDTAGFSKLGIQQTTANSGIYQGIPIVMSPNADFYTMEFVFRSQRR